VVARRKLTGPSNSLLRFRIGIGFLFVSTSENRASDRWRDHGIRPESIGTAFAVDYDTMVTAHHVAWDETSRHYREGLEVGFDSRRTASFSIVDCGPELVYLKLAEQDIIPPHFDLVETTTRHLHIGDHWSSLGYPTNMLSVDSIAGTVENPDVQIGEETITFLHCYEAATKDLYGFSGAPVLVEEPDGFKRSIGVVVKAPKVGGALRAYQIPMGTKTKTTGVALQLANWTNSSQAQRRQWRVVPCRPIRQVAPAEAAAHLSQQRSTARSNHDEG
jgi:hypothetical protein